VKCILRIVCILIIFILLFRVADAAINQPRVFLDGIQSYHSGSFFQAVESFRQLTNAGIRNGKLFYNLANAYLKNNDLGHAILWYARAARLIPRDPDLKFNYNYALSLAEDQSEDKNSGIFRILFFWNYMLGRTTIQWIAIVLNLFLWLILIMQRVRKNRNMNRIGLVLAPFVLIFSITVFYHFYEDTHSRQAVIFYEKVSVRSGFAGSSTELFVLHAGTRVAVEKTSRNFLKIRFSDDKIGWIKAEEAGMI